MYFSFWIGFFNRRNFFLFFILGGLNILLFTFNLFLLVNFRDLWSFWLSRNNFILLNLLFPFIQLFNIFHNFRNCSFFLLIHFLCLQFQIAHCIITGFLNPNCINFWFLFICLFFCNLIELLFLFIFNSFFFCFFFIDFGLLLSFLLSLSRKFS